MQIKCSSRNASLTLVFIALIFLLLAQPQELVESEYAGTNTGIIGANPSLDGSVIAFTTYEDDAGEDLNGDGDRLDRVIRYYDISTGVVTNTQVEGNMPFLVGNIIVSHTDENPDWGVGLDLNGDGDMDDRVIRYHDVSTSRLTNTEAVGYGPTLDGDIIAFRTPEGQVSRDLNLDGDTNDSIIRYYDMSSQTATSTGAEGYSTSVYGTIIAFVTFEADAGVDLNGDGDTTDSVIGYHDITTGEATNTGIVGGSPVLDGDVIAFDTHEGYVDQDLNGDGDTEDDVIGYYAISTDATTYTSAVGSVQSFDGNRITFDRWVTATAGRGWFEAGYCDISTDEVTVIGAGDSPSLDGDIIAFGIWERHVDEDLNGDQDQEDNLIWYYVIGVDEPAEWPSEQAGGTDWRLILIAAVVIAAAFVLAVVILRR